jgi:holo-[acyl-carrier protein] synthase
MGAPLVGFDLVEIGEVHEALARHGRRYLDRLYTPGEQRDCAPGGVPSPALLAERFAAKEAALKALGGPGGVPATDVEVTGPPGRPRLRLHGEAQRAADSADIRSIFLSVSRHATMATAMVLADTGTR